MSLDLRHLFVYDPSLSPRVSGQRRGQEVYYAFNPKKYYGMLQLLASSISSKRH